MGRGSTVSEKRCIYFCFCLLQFRVFLQLYNSFFLLESDTLVGNGLGIQGCLSPDWLCEFGQVPTSLWLFLRNACYKVVL